MNTPPPDLGVDELRRAIAREWPFEVDALEYLPVGFGAHHWRATDSSGTRRFVTVDVLEHSHLAGDPGAAIEVLERALRTAAALHHAERLEFVVPPLRTTSGNMTHRLQHGYALSVFPFVEGASADHGAYGDAEERSGLRRSVLQTLRRLHDAQGVAGSGAVRPETFDIPNRADLVGALDELDTPWMAGPFAERARRLLRDGAVKLRASLRAYDAAAEAARGSAADWVVTHGEPHRANVIRRYDGAVFLVDWDTVKLAPRERDLWMVLGADGADLAGYWTAGSGERAVDDRLISLYREWWVLADVASFTGRFRRPHGRTRDDEIALNARSSYLSPGDA